MPRVKIGNAPEAALRWSVERAGIEFGLTEVTLRKALAKNSAKADADGCFSTKQITEAVFGSMHIEKLATQREVRRKLELENAITEASVLNRAALSAGFAALADAMKSRIMTDAALSRETKKDILRDLASWPIILEDAAQTQSKLKRSKNGQAVEEDVVAS
jgi:hypothetical protein